MDKQRKGLRLIARAIKERWQIPKGKRPKLAKKLFEILETNTDARCVVHAARALLEADKVNLEQEKRDAGGETLNLNVTVTADGLSDDQLASIAARGIPRTGGGRIAAAPESENGTS